MSASCGLPKLLNGAGSSGNGLASGSPPLSNSSTACDTGDKGVAPNAPLNASVSGLASGSSAAVSGSNTAPNGPVSGNKGLFVSPGGGVSPPPPGIMPNSVSSASVNGPVSGFSGNKAIRSSSEVGIAGGSFGSPGSPVPSSKSTNALLTGAKGVAPKALSSTSDNGVVTAPKAPVTGAKALPSGVVITPRGFSPPGIPPAPGTGIGDEPSPSGAAVPRVRSVQTS